jgi:hypothetical protein
MKIKMTQKHVWVNGVRHTIVGQGYQFMRNLLKPEGIVGGGAIQFECSLEEPPSHVHRKRVDLIRVKFEVAHYTSPNTPFTSFGLCKEGLQESFARKIPKTFYVWL